MKYEYRKYSEKFSMKFHLFSDQQRADLLKNGNILSPEWGSKSMGNMGNSETTSLFEKKKK